MITEALILACAMVLCTVLYTAAKMAQERKTAAMKRVLFAEIVPTWERLVSHLTGAIPEYDELDDLLPGDHYSNN